MSWLVQVPMCGADEDRETYTKEKGRDRIRSQTIGDRHSPKEVHNVIYPNQLFTRNNAVHAVSY